MNGLGELVDGMINQTDIYGYVLKNIIKQELRKPYLLVKELLKQVGEISLEKQIPILYLA